MASKNSRTRRRAVFIEALEERCFLSASFNNSTENAMAYNSSNGKLYVVYLDQTSGSAGLKSKVRNSDGSWTNLGTIDSDTDTGHYPSMAIDGAGNVGVAYYVGGSFGDLRYAVYNGTSWSSPETADSTGTVGYYPSLAYNTANKPAISYYDNTTNHHDLKFVQRGSSSWATPVTVDSANDVGRYSSLKLNPNNTSLWAVAYEQTGIAGDGINDGIAKYLEQTQSGVWPTPGSSNEVYKSDAGGGYTSLQFIYNGTSYDPAMSFYDSVPANLMYDQRVAGAWPTALVVAANNIQGRYTNLLVQSNNRARIVFQGYYVDSAGNNVDSVRVADAPLHWQVDQWNYDWAYSGGGAELKAARVSDSEFFYSRVGTNPTSPYLYVSNYKNEGKNYVQSTSSAFSTGGRYGHSTVVFPDSANSNASTMWTLGGFSSALSNEVYSSTDGATWTLRTTTGIFSARDNFAAAVLNGKIYVIGGNTAGGAVGDLYSSTDGVTWQLVSTSTALPARYGHTAVVLNGAIYVIGGMGTSGRLNDVWKFDGTDWSQVASGGGSRFSARYRHVSYAYNGNLWVASGDDGSANGYGGLLSDVWYSSDSGATWTQASAATTFGHHADAAAVVFDNRMWITQGTEAYYSSDGTTWLSSTTSAEFSDRHQHTMAVLNDRLYVIGGTGATGVGNSVYYAKSSSSA